MTAYVASRCWALRRWRPRPRARRLWRRASSIAGRRTSTVRRRAAAVVQIFPQVARIAISRVLVDQLSVALVFFVIVAFERCRPGDSRGWWAVITITCGSFSRSKGSTWWRGALGDTSRCRWVRVVLILMRLIAVSRAWGTLFRDRPDLWRRTVSSSIGHHGCML